MMDTPSRLSVMGIVQGLTEFLPVSSSGHLIIVPFLFGWTDPFITSLAFSVMLHIGTLLALLIYFWHEWLRLVPAGLATIRDRSFDDDPDRKLAWLLVAATIPAALAGFLLNDVLEKAVREPGLVAVMLVVGAVILWLADRWGGLSKGIARRDVPARVRARCGAGTRAHPGDQPLGRLDLGRPVRRARPRGRGPVLVPDGDPDHRRRRDLRGPQAGDRRSRASRSSSVPLLVGMIAAFVSGVLAIRFMLRYLQTRSLTIFVVYRLVVAAVVDRRLAALTATVT